MKTRFKSIISDFLKLMNQRGEVGESDSGSSDSGESSETSESSESSEESSEESIEASSEETSSIEEPSEESSESSEESGEIQVQANTEEELEQEIQEAIQDGATEEEVENMVRQFVIKVDGKELTKEIDLSDEEAVKRELQLAYKGQKTMQELQELKKLYSQELENILANPFEALQKLNPDFDPLKASGDYLDRLLKEQEMSPEEKKEIQMQQELEKLREERDRLQKEKEENEMNEKMAKVAAEIETDIMSALENDPDLIADRDTVALVAENLHWAAKNNIDISAKEVLPTVKAQLKEQFQKASARFKNTASLKDFMGQELLEKLREERVQQAKKQVASVNNIKNVTKEPSKKEEKREKVKLSSLFS